MDNSWIILFKGGMDNTRIILFEKGTDNSWEHLYQHKK